MKFDGTKALRFLQTTLIFQDIMILDWRIAKIIWRTNWGGAGGTGTGKKNAGGSARAPVGAVPGAGTGC